MDSTGYESSTSNQSNQSSAPASRGTFYAVYLYSNSLKPQQTPETETGEDGTEKTAPPKTTSKSTYKPSLSLLATDLGAVAETDLRCYLLKRVARNLQDSRGNTDAIQLGLGEKATSSMMCFHQAFEKQTADLEKKEQQAYVLCFIAPDDGTLDLFCTDLERYGRSLLPLLTNSEIEFQTALTSALEEWHSTCVLYMSRCIRLLSSDVAVLLHAALCQTAVKVTAACSRTKDDVQGFMNACNLHNLETQDVQDGPQLDAHTTKLEVKVDAIVEDTGVTFNRSDSSTFCQKWAERLVKSENDGPLILRRIIEGFKIKTIQDLNLIKRLVRKAENDHYALFSAYQFLKNCGYWETLLERAMKEGSLVTTPEGQEVVGLLQERLRGATMATLIKGAAA